MDRLSKDRSLDQLLGCLHRRQLYNAEGGLFTVSLESRYICGWTHILAILDNLHVKTLDERQRLDFGDPKGLVRLRKFYEKVHLDFFSVDIWLRSNKSRLTLDP